MQTRIYTVWPLMHTAMGLRLVRQVERNELSNWYSLANCASGETGRRAGLRIQWGNPWEFKSPLAHHHATQRPGRDSTLPPIVPRVRPHDVCRLCHPDRGSSFRAQRRMVGFCCAFCGESARARHHDQCPRVCCGSCGALAAKDHATRIRLGRWREALNGHERVWGRLVLFDRAARRPVRNRPSMSLRTGQSPETVRLSR